MAALSFLDRQHTIAPPGYSRWLIPPAALAIHLCIGQAYATSVYKASLVAHFDTNLTNIGIIFSIAIVMLGLSAAVFGKWVDHGGPRKAMFAAACCWATGFVVGSIGIHTHQLWLVYLGYGFIGGCGLGIGYISPVSTLIKWFPDRPGMATGMAIMGFGGGAMVASPLMVKLLNTFNGGVVPADSVYPGEVVAKMFAALAVIYFAVMMLGVFTVRVPAPGWKPHGWEPSQAHAKPMIATDHVSADNAIKTPQFWLLWTVLLCNVTAGIGLLEQAALMVQDFFRNDAGVSTVTVAAAAGFVGFLSMFNMAGRFIWSSVSDYLGRKVNYIIYLGVGMVAYFFLATAGGTSMVLFIALCALIASFYGGGFATIPAYLRDMFGTFEVGAIHGRLLTAWSTAGILGPLIINRLLDAQGEPGTLEAANYRTPLLTMVAILAVGFVANLLVKPVNAKYQEPDTLDPIAEPAH